MPERTRRMITIQREVWDRDAAAAGSLWDSEKAADALRANGYRVQIVSGDRGSAFWADTETEYRAITD